MFLLCGTIKQGSSSRAIASSMLGQILRQRYKIIRQLGEGGFGTTYLAEDLDIPVTPKPKCVVKQLHPQMINADIVGRFEKEGQVLYRLGQQHDQIPDLFAYFEENGQFYLIQEFIEGRTIESEMEGGRQWNEAETLSFLREVLEVLVFVHQNRVIHRDIKPSNIMRRDRDRKLVLIDFGIVKEISAIATQSPGQSAPTLAIGTPGYMPSEQMVGQPRLSSDIYALGMTAIRGLTGVEPDSLPTDERGEVVWRNRAAIGEGLAAILAKMTRYHFRDRYSDATEALQALSESPETAAATVAVSPRLPTYATPPTNANATVPASPPASGSSRGWLMGIAIAIAASAATAILYSVLKPSPQGNTAERERTPMRSPQSEDTSTPPQTRSQQPEDTSISPEARSPQPEDTSISPEARSPQPISPGERSPQNGSLSASGSVPIFPVNTPRTDVERSLGQPARDLRGAYGNTRAVVYDSVQSGVDLGYLFDRNSGRIQQTESSFRQFVKLPVMSQTLDGLLNGEMTAEIERGLEQVHRGQLNNYRFNFGSLKGQIIRQDCGDIYISIWDAQLHDFVSFESVRRC
ncbi:MAG: protein kinase [Cyanobacteriota bacterium]|nr:protein kinase [Cyanobacteriota bacterium]